MIASNQTVNTFKFAFEGFDKDKFLLNDFNNDMGFKGLIGKMKSEGFDIHYFKALTIDQIRALSQRFPHNILLEVDMTIKLLHIMVLCQNTTRCTSLAVTIQHKDPFCAQMKILLESIAVLTIQSQLITDFSLFPAERHTAI